MKGFIEDFKGKHLKPFVVESILLAVSLLVGVPEFSQEGRTVAKPTLSLDKIEKKQAIENLKGQIMSPLLVVGLMLEEMVLKDMKELFITLEEIVFCSLYAKYFFNLIENI